LKFQERYRINYFRTIEIWHCFTVSGHPFVIVLQRVLFDCCSLEQLVPLLRHYVVTHPSITLPRLLELSYKIHHRSIRCWQISTESTLQMFR